MMVRDNPESWLADQTPVSIYNPLTKEIKIERYNDANEAEIYTLLPLSAATYPAYIANYIKRHLVDIIVNERKIGLITPEKRSSIEEEISI